MSGPYRATCPHCAAAIVVMSDLNPSVAMTVPPSRGDLLRCDRCTKLCAVGVVEGDIVRVLRVDLPSDAPTGANAARLRRVLS